MDATREQDPEFVSLPRTVAILDTRTGEVREHLMAYQNPDVPLVRQSHS